MSEQLCKILQGLDPACIAGVDPEEVLEHYEYYTRLSRASWLKRKYGELKIPSDLFATVVDAEVKTSILDQWYEFGGIQCVYYYCKTIFGGGEYVDYGRLREIQKEIGRSQA